MHLKCDPLCTRHLAACVTLAQICESFSFLDAIIGLLKNSEIRSTVELLQRGSLPRELGLMVPPRRCRGEIWVIVILICCVCHADLVTISLNHLIKDFETDF